MKNFVNFTCRCKCKFSVEFDNLLERQTIVCPNCQDKFPEDRLKLLVDGLKGVQSAKYDQATGEKYLLNFSITFAEDEA